MNAAFGIDHPLIAVRDLCKLRSRLIAIGFNMTAVGRHPWGTSTSLAMFDGCLIEIMGIYNETLLDEVPAGDFRFGRHVHSHLHEREGVALTALHGTDAVQDAARAAEAGLTVNGFLEFGRDVVLPDGKAGRTKTTLALMPDPVWPRLSFFLCQQHRPDLIYVPSRLKHSNTVHGISAITILTSGAFQPALAKKLAGLYGIGRAAPGGCSFNTANGEIRIFSEAAFEDKYGPLLAGLQQTSAPCIVGMELKYKNETALETCLRDSGAAYSKQGHTFYLADPDATGNTLLGFVPG